jgi:hypothetical protein
VTLFIQSTVFFSPFFSSDFKYERELLVHDFD